MPGLGNKLRIKRLAMGLSPRDAAKMSGIKQKYVWALEEEDVLKFPDKDAVVESIEAYSSALGLEIAEMTGEFEKLWSDAGTAKMYMQQKYNRKGFFAIFGENKTLGYGAIALAAVLFLSLGGYMVWGNFFAPDEPEDYIIATPDEAELEEVEEVVVSEESNEDPAAGLSPGMGTEDGEEEEPQAEVAAQGEIEDINASADDAALNESPEYTPMTGGYALSYSLSMFSFLTGFALFLVSLTCKKT